MKSRIEEVLSRILSEKYDAKIKIRFKERKKCHQEKTKQSKN